MKLLYTITILLCLTSYGSLQAQNTSEGVLVRISFNGLHCDGKNGLCALELSGKQLANASLTYNKDGTLSVFINRDKLNPTEIETLFGRPYDDTFRSQLITFAIEKEFIISLSTKLELNIPSSKNRIVMDGYPIVITNQHFIITLNLE